MWGALSDERTGLSFTVDSTAATLGRSVKLLLVFASTVIVPSRSRIKIFVLT
jgi:hypothetical protein